MKEDGLLKAPGIACWHVGGAPSMVAILTDARLQGEAVWIGALQAW